MKIQMKHHLFKILLAIALIVVAVFAVRQMTAFVGVQVGPVAVGAGRDYNEDYYNDNYNNRHYRR